MASFIKDLVSVAVSKSTVIVFGLAKSIILARWLGPEGNGIIAALVVYPSLLLTFSSLGIRQSTTYFIGKNKYPEAEIKTSITQIWFFTQLISIVISFILIRYFTNVGDNLLLVLLAITPIPFSLFNTYNSGIFLGKNQIKIFNRINWIPALVVFLSIILFVIVLNLEIAGALLSTATGALFMFVLLLIKNDFIRSFSIRFNFKIVKALFSLGIVYGLSSLVISLNYRVDVILLDQLSTPYELGIYSKGVGIIEYLWEIPMLLSTIIFARSAAAKDDLAYSRKVTHLLRLSMIAITFGVIVLFLIARIVIVGFYGLDFEPSTAVLRMLVPGVLLLTFYKVLNMDLAGKGKPWVSMKAMIPALLVNLLLNFILIPSYGANGAAISSTISYSVAALLFMHFYSRQVEIPITQILRFSVKDFDPILQLIRR